MLLRPLKYLPLLLPLLLGGTAQAEPFTLLMGMAALQSTFSSDEQTAQDRQQNGAVNEHTMLAQLQQHPVVSACLEAAEDDNPVATYHLRKLGQHAQSLLKGNEHQSPDPARVAKAYRWCAQQAGIAEQDIALSQSSFSAALQMAARGDMREALRVARADEGKWQ